MYLHLEGLQHLRDTLKQTRDTIKDSINKKEQPKLIDEFIRNVYGNISSILSDYAKYADEIIKEIRNKDDLLMQIYEKIKNDVYISGFKKTDSLPVGALHLHGDIIKLQRLYLEFKDIINSLIHTDKTKTKLEGEFLAENILKSLNFGINICDSIQTASEPIAKELKTQIRQVKEYKHILNKSVKDAQDFENNLSSWLRAA